LGHDVYLVEKSSGWDCFDPGPNLMGHDASHGLRVVDDLLARNGLAGRYCFVDAAGAHFGADEGGVRELFRTADLYVDAGCHGTWAEQAAHSGRRVLVDLEPAYNQMRIARELIEGRPQPEYDAYYTNGMNIPRRHSIVPDCGVSWRTVFNPVSTTHAAVSPPAPGAPFTTVMNWQAHGLMVHRGEEYGQKDREFPKFLNLPRRVSAPLEIAVSGKNVPFQDLAAAGWRVRSAHEATATFDQYHDYIRLSAGEFSVAKNVFVKTRGGWFSDRSAAYLASGRPVVLQETGFSEHLPCGEGLFAVEDEDQAAAAIDRILTDPARHARRAREIAVEYLDTRVVLRKFLHENGL
jgi:hypothetical protein